MIFIKKFILLLTLFLVLNLNVKADCESALPNGWEGITFDSNNNASLLCFNGSCNSKSSWANLGQLNAFIELEPGTYTLWTNDEDKKDLNHFFANGNIATNTRAYILVNSKGNVDMNTDFYVRTTYYLSDFKTFTINEDSDYKYLALYGVFDFNYEYVNNNLDKLFLVKGSEKCVPTFKPPTPPTPPANDNALVSNFYTLYLDKLKFINDKFLENDYLLYFVGVFILFIILEIFLYLKRRF